MNDRPRDRAAILERYAQGPQRLEAVLAGLNEAQLDLAPDDSSWSIRQYVHHIVDGDDIWKTCIKGALGGGGDFALQWYWQQPQDLWAAQWQYAHRPLDASLALFRANRRHIVELLEHVPDPWERSMHIRWPGGEEMDLTVGYVVEMQGGHVLGHIDDILRILGRET